MSIVFLRVRDTLILFCRHCADAIVHFFYCMVVCFYHDQMLWNSSIRTIISCLVILQDKEMILLLEMNYLYSGKITDVQRAWLRGVHSELFKIQGNAWHCKCFYLLWLIRPQPTLRELCWELSEVFVLIGYNFSFSDSCNKANRRGKTTIY